MDAKTEAQTETTEAQQVETEAKPAETQEAQTEVKAESMSDEAKLAAEALAATEEPAGDSPEIEGLKKEDERLVGSITAKRQVLRELDKKLAENLAVDKATHPPEKSPEEKYIEDHVASFDPEAEPFPANVQIAQRKWDKEQTDNTRKRQEEDSVASSANKFYIKARERISDYDEVVLDAEDLLTEGDQVDVKNAARRGEDPAEMLYKICTFKTLLAGGDRATKLRAKLRAKVPSKAKASVEKQTNEQQSDGSEQDKGGPAKAEPKPAGVPASAEEVISSPQLAHIYSAFLGPD